MQNSKIQVKIQNNVILIRQFAKKHPARDPSTFRMTNYFLLLHCIFDL